MKHAPGSFGLLPRRCQRALPDLGAADLRVYCALCLHTNHERGGEVTGGCDWLGRACGLHPDVVARALKRLVGLGLLDRLRRGGGREGDAARFRICFEDRPENPTVESGSQREPDRVPDRVPDPTVAHIRDQKENSETETAGEGAVPASAEILNGDAGRLRLMRLLAGDDPSDWSGALEYLQQLPAEQQAAALARRAGADDRLAAAIGFAAKSDPRRLPAIIRGCVQSAEAQGRKNPSAHVRRCVENEGVSLGQKQSRRLAAAALASIPRRASAG